MKKDWIERATDWQFFLILIAIAAWGAWKLSY